MSEIKVNSIKGVGASAAAITVNNSDGTCTANITNNLSNRNKVINGSMIVNQRGNQSATGSAGYFACDRFKTNNGCGAQVAISQSTDAPDGFANSMKWETTTADTSIAANDSFLIRYTFEGQDLQDMQKGTSSAKQVTLSFYAKSVKQGTFIVELMDDDNSSRHVNKSFTISNTNWNRYTITFPADTTGAFNNDNLSSMDMNFWLVAGTSYTTGTLQTTWGASAVANRAVGQVNAMDSTSNNFYLTGVQLEVSDHATSFEHRSYSQELQLCKRYYQMFSTGVNTYTGLTSFYYNSTRIETMVRYEPQMRTSPSLEQGSGSNYFILYSNNQADTFDGFGGINAGCNLSGSLYQTTGLSGTAGHAGGLYLNSPDAYIAFTAEL